MPSALITGVTGQDGSYLAERLRADGWDVHGMVRDEQVPDEQEVPDWLAAHRGDLLDPETLGDVVATVAPDAIVNLAGITSVALSWEQPELVGRASGLAVGTLLQAALDLQERAGRPVRFIQATSAEIFGGSEDEPQSETTEISPVSPYGAAKAYAHHLVGVYRRRGLAATSAILYNHESPRRPPTFVTRKITRGVAEIAGGVSGELRLGNLDARRDWGWAPDYVDAMVRMLGSAEGDDYVVATGEAHSIREFVQAAFAVAGIADWERYVVQDERFMRPEDPAVLRGDASKAQRVLGWRPTVSFDELVRTMVEHDLELLRP